MRDSFPFGINSESPSLMSRPLFFNIPFRGNGIPNLSNESFAIVMNFVHFEGRIHVYQSLKKKREGNYKYDIDIQKCIENLERLTNVVIPYELIMKLICNL
jgi:hypothetical protein